MKIVFCGSMSESKKMIAAAKELTGLGHNVVLPENTSDYAVMNNTDNVLAESANIKINQDLIRGHYRKIDSSDAILVINVERHGIKHYIGGNAFLEMGFAHILHKPIYLLNNIPNISYRDEIVAMSPIILNNDLSNLSL